MAFSSLRISSIPLFLKIILKDPIFFIINELDLRCIEKILIKSLTSFFDVLNGKPFFFDSIFEIFSLLKLVSLNF